MQCRFLHFCKDTELIYQLHRLFDNEISGHHIRSLKQLEVMNWFHTYDDDSVHNLPSSDSTLKLIYLTTIYQESLTNLMNLGQIIKLKPFNIEVSI